MTFLQSVLSKSLAPAIPAMWVERQWFKSSHYPARRRCYHMERSTKNTSQVSEVI
jgi:hypothetical protein